MPLEVSKDINVQAGFRKGRGTRDQIANIHWIIEKAREFHRNIYFCFIDYTKAFDCVDHNKPRKILKETEIPDHLTCLLRNLYAGQEATEPNMEQRTDSKSGKEYIKAVYCHPAYLTFMQSTSWEMLAWMKHKLESRFPGKYLLLRYWLCQSLWLCRPQQTMENSERDGSTTWPPDLPLEKSVCRSRSNS